MFVWKKGGKIQKKYSKLIILEKLNYNYLYNNIVNHTYNFKTYDTISYKRRLYSLNVVILTHRNFKGLCLKIYYKRKTLRVLPDDCLIIALNLTRNPHNSSSENANFLMFITVIMISLYSVLSLNTLPLMLFKFQAGSLLC